MNVTNADPGVTLKRTSTDILRSINEELNAINQMIVLGPVPSQIPDTTPGMPVDRLNDFLDIILQKTVDIKNQVVKLGLE